jgi:hypothetical protein
MQEWPGAPGTVRPEGRGQAEKVDLTAWLEQAWTGCYDENELWCWELGCHQKFNPWTQCQLTNNVSGVLRKKK